MKNFVHTLPLLVLINTSFISCSKEGTSATGSQAGTGFVSGKVTDAAGNYINGAEITIEHTVWYDSYLKATTGSDGKYKIDIPSEPAGDWTAKAQLTKAAYGQNYIFDLQPNSNDPFTRNKPTIRDFAWKLSGSRSGTNLFYGAHIDVYQLGTDVEMNAVKLILTPYPGEDTLIDGSTARTIERNLQDVAGTFMLTDIPVGKYQLKATYPGKTLLLQNRHSDEQPAVEATVVFGKYGNLGETEYNIEFWLSE